MAEASPPRARPPILEVRGLSKRFMVQGRTVEALRDVDLQITKGEFVCLIGASGCGKSTLLRSLAGFETASAGTVQMHGRPITGPGPERGMVFQDFGLFPWLTVQQNIAFGPRQRGLPAAELSELSARFTEMVGLGKFAHYYPAQLSGGMKQRVAIARALANDCEVLLMDEPFGALDALTREKLQQELLDIWARTRLTVVFVTHAVEEAVMLADRVVVMTAGPGRIEEELLVTLPRPRDSTGIEFNAVRREVTQRLSSHLHVASST